MMGRAIGALSLRVRLTLWYSVALLAVLGIFAAVVLWQQGRIGVRRVDRELDALTSTVANVLRDELTETPDAREAASEVRRTIAVPGRAVAILGADGRELAASWQGLTPAALTLSQGAAPRTWTARTGAGDWRVHLAPAGIQSHNMSVLVAAPMADALREQRESEEAMWVGIPTAWLLAVLGGLWLASVGLRPMTEMAHRAERLAPSAAEDLGESDRRDELGQFARAFNGLVDRLRHTLQTQRQFMADASHELRTPVSIIQTASDITLSSQSRTDDEYREALTITGTEARRLGRLVDDMLVLARADAGGYPLRRSNLYVNEIVGECRRAVEVLARERGVTVQTSVDGDVPFRGDEDLLRRMILNLLQNAVTYTRPGSAVRVDVAHAASAVHIRVEDEGEGIPARDRQRIFERFVQADPSRRNAGAGLGLAIARWIAEAHGGSLDLAQSRHTGSVFQVVLPLKEEEAALIHQHVATGRVSTATTAATGGQP